MGKLLSFIETQHRSTPRNYLSRVTSDNKAECAAVAKKYGKDYWDGDRKYGYGGYRYDGRWATLAKRLIDHYQLGPKSKILDVGCGKGFLLHELKKLLPTATIAGVDISDYAIENAKEEIRPFLKKGDAKKLDFASGEFDLVISITTLHNLYLYDLTSAIKEIARVSKGNGYIVVESYRNETEKMNLLYWQLTCEAFFTPKEWVWLFEQNGYSGDYEFICFE